MMKKGHALRKVFFNFGANEWHGHASESVWAEQIGETKFRIRNTPFFAKGVSFEDIVSAQFDGEKLTFDKVLISAGHSSYRLLVKRELVPDPFQRFWQPLQNLGCSYEENAEMALAMFAIDVPPLADIHQVYDLLKKGEENGVWDFEEGHVGHLTNRTQNLRE